MKWAIAIFSISLTVASCSKTKVINDIIDSVSSIDNRSVGGAAHPLLSADTKSLKVEVQYMTGFAPDAGALDHLQNFLAARLNKPNGISINTKEISASSNTTLSASDVLGIETANRTVHSAGDAATVYVLYTNGQYTENNVLGVAYKGTSVALFGKKIRDNSGGIGQASRTKLEATVLEHEIGHLLGLVDNGTTMQTPHKDASHGAHCNNQNCLMYYATETTDILGFLITGNIPLLDANCIADLQANGGK